MGVNPDLRAVVERAIEITPIDFGVSDGKRSMKRQREYYKTGKSKTLNSKHLTGDAVDLFAYVGAEACWDWDLYVRLNATMQIAADELGVELVWGGSWKGFRDGCHWELA